MYIYISLLQRSYFFCTDKTTNNFLFPIIRKKFETFFQINHFYKIYNLIICSKNIRFLQVSKNSIHNSINFYKFCCSLWVWSLHPQSTKILSKNYFFIKSFSFIYKIPFKVLIYHVCVIENSQKIHITIIKMWFVVPFSWFWER